MVDLCRGQYIIGGAVVVILILVYFLVRLAGNPPFLLGRRGDGELPVQLLVDGEGGRGGGGGGSGSQVVGVWRW